MNVWRIQNSEGKLLNVLQDVSPLAWRKYRRRAPEGLLGSIRENGDLMELPPFVSFRFISPSEKIINTLRDALLSFEGKVRWALVEHKREPLPGSNWMICPQTTAAAEFLNADEYLAKYDQTFIRIAFEDLNDLTEYVRKKFEESGSDKAGY
jgi:hypothetical protein